MSRLIVYNKNGVVREIKFSQVLEVNGKGYISTDAAIPFFIGENKRKLKINFDTKQTYYIVKKGTSYLDTDILYQYVHESVCKFVLLSEEIEPYGEDNLCKFFNCLISDSKQKTIKLKVLIEYCKTPEKEASDKRISDVLNSIGFEGSGVYKSYAEDTIRLLLKHFDLNPKHENKAVTSKNTSNKTKILNTSGNA